MKIQNYIKEFDKIFGGRAGCDNCLSNRQERAKHRKFLIETMISILREYQSDSDPSKKSNIKELQDLLSHISTDICECACEECDELRHYRCLNPLCNKIFQ